MKIMHRTALTAVIALATVTSSNAAQLFTGLGGPNYAEMVHNNGDAIPTDNLLVLDTKPSGYLVNYTAAASDVLTVTGPSNGFAKVDGPFTELTIDPQVGFTKLGFNLDPEKLKKVDIGRDKVDPIQSLLIDVHFVGGGTQTFNTGYAPNTKFDIIAQGLEQFDSVKLYAPTWIATSGLVSANGTYTFDSIRQVSFDPTTPQVPEPASWAMMIAGFGMVGAAMRRRAGKAMLA